MARLQIDVTDEHLRELEALMERAGVSTKKDLFNNAVTLLAWALDEVRKGHTIASINESEQKYRELQMPIFNAARQRDRTVARAAG